MKPLLGMIEERLASFGPRPHWGKLFVMNPEKLQSQYERLQDFRELLRSDDPAGKFGNAFLRRIPRLLALDTALNRK
ncbi:MAG: D-arabinono-1,4-lactone oxidase [Acidobacteriaceae bacterium]